MTVEMARLTDRAEEIGKQVTELERRLESILRPVGPTACPVEGKQEMSTPLIDRMREVKSRLENTIANLRSILDRCEL